MKNRFWDKLPATDRYLIYACLGFLITKGFDSYFKAYSAVAEYFYFGTVFQAIRSVYDTLLGWSPVPMFYIVVSFVLFLLGRIVYRVIRGRLQWMMGIKQLAVILLWVYSIFFWIWGFNYSRPSITELLDMPHNKVQTADIVQEAYLMTHHLNRLHTLKETSSIPENLEEILRDEVTRLMHSWDMPTSGKGRMRIIDPDGLLLRFSTSGMYFPHACEGMVDRGLHNLQIPSTMAHEFGHVYGFGEESTCNLIALLACVQSKNAYIQYSGILSYWRYLVRHIRSAEPDTYKDIYSTLDAGVRNDLDAIQKRMQNYPDILPQLRNLLYDNYLKSQGVSGGIANYSYVIDLVHRWKQTKHNRDIYTLLYSDGHQ